MARHTSLSLERKLPLLISVLLSALAVGLTWAGYVEVRRASELRGTERLRRLAEQIAELAQRSTEQRATILRRVATDAALVAELTSPTTGSRNRVSAALTAALATARPDQPIVAELRSTSEAVRITTHPELSESDGPVRRLITGLSRDGPPVSDLYSRGDSVYYWVGVPVSSDRRVVGYLVQRRLVSSGSNLERQLRGLTGTDSVSIFVASDSGSVWSSLSGRPVQVPSLATDADADGPNVIRYTRGSGRRYVGVMARVPNTPFTVIAETPYETLLDRPSAFLRRNVVVAIVMLVIGMLAAWLLSRHITRPLRQLTAVADAMSTGDYSQRAHVVRRDETGRLADAFNTMAEQVQRSHEDLARQNDESRTLAARLEEANRAKADFLATMSHELRTPLNAIGGYVDLIELGVRGPVTEDQRRDLERVRYNQRHLLTLIGNILDFTRLDAQKLSYEIGDVRIDTVVTEILTGVAPLLDEKGLTRECVGCNVAAVARADRARVEQILLNLLSNGVRFTPAGGHITLTVRDRGETVTIEVADSGIGIPPEKLASVFEPFVQLDSGLTRQVGGTGLGLTISRELARAMGGDLTGESDGKQGARFCLTLPSARVFATGKHPPRTDQLVSLGDRS
ncbi:MAG TPA: ATP-binding protein [Gemmatimonadaceae bacterium]|jgi:signal transduction histidine kinase|nr:ATP-binding protein [Gemmatimonadaceae bacterium]